MPTLTLLAVESFCAGAGVILFILGLISCFVPRHFRLGVITMCISNIFFVLAIAFPEENFIIFFRKRFSGRNSKYRLSVLGRWLWISFSCNFLPYLCERFQKNCNKT